MALLSQKLTNGVVLGIMDDYSYAVSINGLKLDRNTIKSIEVGGNNVRDCYGSIIYSNGFEFSSQEKKIKCLNEVLR